MVQKKVAAIVLNKKVVAMVYEVMQMVQKKVVLMVLKKVVIMVLKKVVIMVQKKVVAVASKGCVDGLEKGRLKEGRSNGLEEDCRGDGS